MRLVLLSTGYQLRWCMLPRKAEIASMTFGDGGTVASFQSSLCGSWAGRWWISSRDETAL